MESRLIYSVVNSGQLDLDWQINKENEWFHIGTGNEIKKEFIIQKIKETFDNKNFFIALGRTDSKEINAESIEQEIITRVGKENFKICNKSFSKFIEFRDIGILRIGKK
jgi:hypothetical protein